MNARHTAQTNAILAALCLLASVFMLWTAYQFHVMEAGLLPIVSTIGACFCFGAFRQFIINIGDEAEDNATAR